MLNWFSCSALTLAVVFATGGLVPTAAQAQEAYLDAPYKNLRKVKVRNNIRFDAVVNKKTAVDVIAKMSPVKSQGRRGTCSIFSAVAALEGSLALNSRASKEYDLSEQFLEYVNGSVSGSDGSTSRANFSYLINYGVPNEETYAYRAYEWKDLFSDPEAKKTCEPMPSLRLQKRCLIAQADPRLVNQSEEDLRSSKSEFFNEAFADARKEAYKFRDQKLAGKFEFIPLQFTDQIKLLLDQGQPVLLDIDFYYGAWNHRKATEFGMTRNMEHWSQGIIGYPEPGSMDRKAFYESPAGHSVLLVGYDDNKIVKTRVEMEDGTVQEFEYKGVYYFKNSWGTAEFGANSEIDGQNFPGYGAITQKYADEIGEFNAYVLKK